MPAGIYTSTYDDYLSNPGPEITWMNRERINPTGFDVDTMYISNDKVNSSPFPQAVLVAYWNKIRLGVAYSTKEEVNNALAYNLKQTDSRKKLTHVASEFEFWNTGRVADFGVLVSYVYQKTQAAGIKNYVYAGWGEEWETIVKYSDGIFLHCYRTTSQANTKDDLYKYCKSRLDKIAAAAKKFGKVYPVTIIFSAEPAFMYDYFKTHKWTDADSVFMESYNRLALASTKQWLIMDGCKIFSHKYMKLIKP